ncbi:branched-chain amino acid ABC transporter permease [Paraburkholderia caballeronis]|uniref:Amino acid/amide ABC transporter membrane protein 2, HAAT family n=1 Tax=Paraburkholderia caballeronis TaxID=416943 RepID=A0A1H7WA11_9BURK|nr:branched-chain amino acid ABC transporter permease [Paraburkholderia caballeronis]PXW25020.1 branched-chain amino acid transport system permease protein [Paraburkholderia caballeronis]PXW92814.1 branched-chain amino acid transport system permease protein [Paraburkholderia caballeronis]RAJ86616.1 branched-chain amino acid transport system permease protein [Paraburkholderia caballeronis]TDV02350.1 branched-chain amino acid transport system permease protein [Paraburkholderia caballeronis]TDV16
MSKPSTLESTLPSAFASQHAPQADALRPARRWLTHPAVIAAVVVVLAVLPFFAQDKFVLSVAVTTFITAIAAASLHLIVRTGHVSLGHAAFMGIGAYVSAIATMNFNLPFPLAVCLAFIAPAALALVVGPILLRLTGKYFVLVTLLFGEIVRTVFVNWTDVTGGSNGISGVPAPSEFFSNPVPFYYLALGFAVVIIGIVGRLLASEIGRTIDSIRESEPLARCSGVPVLRTKVAVFMLGCGIVGVAGALQAHFVHYIDPTSFALDQSLNLVVINVIGGMFTLIGPIVGTLFIVLLPEFLRGYVELQHVFFGIVLILVMAFFSGGIADAGVLLKRMGFSRAGRGGAR